MSIAKLVGIALTVGVLTFSGVPESSAKKPEWAGFFHGIHNPKPHKPSKKPHAVPEPSSFILLASGVGSLLAYRKLSKK